MSLKAKTMPDATSTTLYFGPWYRRSPFFGATLRWGCTAYDVYNHMYLPAYYDDLATEYWALVNDVTLWDVWGGTGGADQRAGTALRWRTCSPAAT